MAAPFLDLFSKLEAAGKSVVDALALSGVTSNTGLDDDSLTAPYVICHAISGSEEVINSGLDRVAFRVIVASNADNQDLAAHRSMVATVFDAFRSDDIGTTLEAAVSDFGVMAVIKTGEKSEVENRKLKNILELDVVCCGADLT